MKDGWEPPRRRYNDEDAEEEEEEEAEGDEVEDEADRDADDDSWDKEAEQGNEVNPADGLQDLQYFPNFYRLLRSLDSGEKHLQSSFLVTHPETRTSSCFSSVLLVYWEGKTLPSTYFPSVLVLKLEPRGCWIQSQPGCYTLDATQFNAALLLEVPEFISGKENLFPIRTFTCRHCENDFTVVLLYCLNAANCDPGLTSKAVKQ